MKQTIEVLERMDQIVVHVRQQFAKDELLTTLVLDEHSATELCAQIGAALAKRRKRAAPAPPKPPEERWYRVETRNNNSPRTCYVRAASEREAHAKSLLRKLHEVELRIDRMPEDFCPPNGKART